MSLETGLKSLWQKSCSGRTLANIAEHDANSCMLFCELIFGKTLIQCFDAPASNIFLACLFSPLLMAEDTALKLKTDCGRTVGGTHIRELITQRRLARKTRLGAWPGTSSRLPTCCIPIFSSTAMDAECAGLTTAWICGTINSVNPKAKALLPSSVA